ncbi:uncharacterized protein LOC126900389 [Daktulosphaira vitifoliae]|uniref:uncharacterized protein LOC126900389 n=1 Tax=Daktulosphaira vitifoliae TaxID=58002 RepID=UPI0021A9D7C8|nr:uncharacterized protein LOC126900389 [Daktulosphaira vitifoliae]
MDSGLTRFALLIVLFLLLTGDITSMLRSFLDESGYSKSTTKTNLATKGTNEEANSDIESLAKSYSNRVKLINIIKESCLPKLICELTASSNRDSLTESERYLLTLIRDTSISLTAEVTSKYHFAAHMGQLINGIDNSGCHNFYPSCPYPGLQVMQMMKKVKIL